MTTMVALKPYRDESAASDFGEGFGTYLASYTAEYHLVEVHLFRATDGDLVAYVTKTPGFRVSDVQDAVTAAVEHFKAKAQPTTSNVRYVYDPSGMATSGSL
jgi:hypothetical protein